MIMKIKDIKGEIIQITDLEKALQQADDFRKYNSNSENFFDKERKIYWQDIYNKLKKLKTNKYK